MAAVADEATHPEWGGGGVWVPVVAIRINPSRSTAACLVAANGPLCMPVIVKTEREPAQALVTDSFCNPPGSDVVLPWNIQKSQ